MDLLGSILNSMDKPPTVSDKQKALMKKEKEEYQRRQKADAERLKIFREKVEEKINNFLRDDVAKEYKFPPMDQIHRSIIHDVAEVANVWAYSFGDEGVDRYIMVFKREHAPSDDQLNALRRGEEWNEEVAKRLIEERERCAKEETEAAKSRKRKDNFVPNSYYKDKYRHLIGTEAALEAARKTEANSSYGCVPSENKKDQRSIEQTLADIRAKKRKLGADGVATDDKEKSTKGIAGTAGAIVTCPLEVVKTRQQSSSSGFYPAPINKELASGHVTCKGFPTPEQRRRLCTGGYTRYTLVALSHCGASSHPAGGSPGIFECLRYIARNEGVGALFKGLGPNIIGVAPSRAIYFCAYSKSKVAFNSLLPPDTPLVHVFSAFCAGFVACTLTNPIWFVKTRLQLDHRTSRTSAIECMRRIYRQSGILGFYKGIVASYVGISETVIHFVIYEAVKTWLAAHRSRVSRGDDTKTLRDFLEFMAAGSFSKTIASTVAYPHEVARTRLREEGTKYRTFWQTLRTVYEEEGSKGLYRGLGTQLIRQIPNTAIIMATYEAVVYVLTRHFHRTTVSTPSSSTSTQFYAEAKAKRELA